MYFFCWIVVQLCLILCDPMHCSTPGLPVLYHPLSQRCHPTISSSVVPFSSCLQSFPASGSFLMIQFSTSSGQCMGALASASILLKNIQVGYPLGLTGLISLQGKGFCKSLLQNHRSLSRVSRVRSQSQDLTLKEADQKHQFFEFSLLCGLALTSIHDFWKNHSFDLMDVCWPSNVSTF